VVAAVHALAEVEETVADGVEETSVAFSELFQ
jgi:hypothetical protein